MIYEDQITQRGISMNLCATQDNIVLKPIIASNITAGGVVLPGEKTFEDGAVVISVGPLVEDIAIGEIVVRPDPPRYTVTDDDTHEMLLICAEADILAKMLPEVTDAADETEETEETEDETDTQEGKVYADGIQEGSVGSLLDIREDQRLPEDDGYERVG